jgi:hypothetical protein
MTAKLLESAEDNRGLSRVRVVLAPLDRLDKDVVRTRCPEGWRQRQGRGGELVRLGAGVPNYDDSARAQGPARRKERFASDAR